MPIFEPAHRQVFSLTGYMQHVYDAFHGAGDTYHIDECSCSASSRQEITVVMCYRKKGQLADEKNFGRLRARVGSIF